jgi:hypothetical protein
MPVSGLSSSGDPPADLEPTPLDVADSRKSTAPTFEDLDPSTVEIRLDRSRCYGWCPEYSIVIRGNGDVHYTGNAFVLLTGEYEGHVPKDVVRDLLLLCEKNGFFGLSLNCNVMVTDVPWATLRVQEGDRTKEIGNPWRGSQSGDQDQSVHTLLDEIAIAIDGAVNVEQWIGSREQRKDLFRGSSDGTPVLKSR